MRIPIVAANVLVVPREEGREATILAHVGQPQGRLVQATLPEATALVERTKARAPGRVPYFPLPSTDAIAAQVDDLRHTIRLALASLSNPRSSNSKGATQGGHDGVQFLEYQDQSDKRRIIRVAERQVDPLEPPRFKHKKAPAPPPSPPPPVLHSPPRKAPIDVERAWKVPPCVSSWKNPKGYTIPLEQRTAATQAARDALPQQVGARFADVSQALYVAEKAAREHQRFREDAQRLQLLTSIQSHARDEENSAEEAEPSSNLKKSTTLTSGLLEDDDTAAVMVDRPLFASHDAQRGLMAFHRVTLDEDIHGRQQADLQDLLKRARALGQRDQAVAGGAKRRRQLLGDDAYGANRLATLEDVKLTEPVVLANDIPDFALAQRGEKEHDDGAKKMADPKDKDIFGLDDLLAEAKQASLKRRS
jgi:hypothetical protein